MCSKRSIDNILKRLDVSLKNEAKKIFDYISENKKKYASNLFNLSLDNMVANKVGNPEISKRPGIYIFKMSKNINCNKSFDSVKNGAKTNDNLKNNTFEAGDVLYLGKTEIGLKSRLNEHLYKCSKKTYSLRLFNKKREYLFGNFVSFTFELKEEYSEHKKIILSTIESELHDLLKPVVGSKRS